MHRSSNAYKQKKKSNEKRPKLYKLMWVHVMLEDLGKQQKQLF